MSITTENFLEYIRKVADRDTSSDPDNWTVENPLYGHCAVVSLVAQDYFGGELVSASLESIPKYAHLKSHYWNRLPDGTEIDFTREQFTDELPKLDGEIKSRDYVLSYPDTKKRYDILRTKLEALL